MELARQYLTANQVCELLQISRRTLTSWIRAGLPVHQMVRRGYLRFDEDEVRAWVQSRCITPTPDQRADSA
jgi:excisionase family DNA binding protein